MLRKSCLTTITWQAGLMMYAVSSISGSDIRLAHQFWRYHTQHIKKPRDIYDLLVKILTNLTMAQYSIFHTIYCS